MKISKLLNNNYLSILLIILLFNSAVVAEDKPIDIWNIEQNVTEEIDSDINQNNKAIDEQVTQSSIYNSQSQKETDEIQLSSSLDSQEVKIIGLYDPEDYDLKIDLWSNSNGDQLKNFFSNLAKIDLSKDASELMNIVLLTNAYNPQINISEIKRPELNASLVGANIAHQLKKKISYRRVVNKTIQSTMRMGAEGIRINVAGRLGGVEIARSEKFSDGSVPLHTLRADIDYALTEAQTQYGIIGIKVWICSGQFSR